MKLHPEVYKKAKLLAIKAKKDVKKLFFGAYRSSIKAEGMIFSDFREYVPGDDVRAISWPLTAKTGKTYIKEFEPEKEQAIIIALDVSGSTEFGTQKHLKSETMAMLSALVAFASQTDKNPIGLILFSDAIELYLPPSKNLSQPHQIIHSIYGLEPRSKKTSFKELSLFTRSVLKKTSLIFLMSDFVSEESFLDLKLMSKKHEVVALFVEDPSEFQLPSWGLVDLKDPETGEILTVDTSPLYFRREYKKLMNERREETLKKIKGAGCELVSINTSKDILLPLVQFFQKGH